MEKVNFYAVVNEDGVDLYADGDAYLAVDVFTKAPPRSRVILTVWDSEGDDAHLLTPQIDVTELVRQAIAKGKA